MPRKKEELYICTHVKECGDSECSHHEHHLLDEACEASICDHKKIYVSCKPVVTDWDK